MNEPRTIPLRPAPPERPIVAALFVLWLAHLLTYVWAVPPWQHYDEPTHFEYAALIRELGRLPTFDEQLPALRRSIAASMIEAGFFQRRDIPLAAIDLDTPNLSLGVNERGVPPAYYALVALATLPFRASPIVSQLYVGRLVSVALALGLFAAAYALLRLATRDWRLRCAALGALVLQPALADNMSALSSDSLAALAAAGLLLAGACFVRRPSPGRLVAFAALALAAMQVKRTLLPLVLLLPLAVYLTLPPVWRRGRWRAGPARAATSARTRCGARCTWVRRRHSRGAARLLWATPPAPRASCARPCRASPLIRCWASR